MLISFYFLIGVFTGVYVGQEYSVPKMKVYVDEIHKLVLQVFESLKAMNQPQKKEEEEEEEESDSEEPMEVESDSSEPEEETMEVESEDEARERKKED